MEALLCHCDEKKDHYNDKLKIMTLHLKEIRNFCKSCLK